MHPALYGALFGFGDVFHARPALLADPQAPGFVFLILRGAAARGVTATPGHADQRSMHEPIGPLQELVQLAAGLAIRLAGAGQQFAGAVGPEK